jgi:NAD+ kinase
MVKPKSNQASSVASDIQSFLNRNGVETIPYTGITDNQGIGKEPEGKIDLLVVVGGDGTVIRAAQRSSDTPILGIKVGALGFLCETMPDKAVASMGKILAGEYFLEHREKFKVSYAQKRLPDVLNEVLVCTSKPSKIMSMRVIKDGEHLHRGKADGVIVSTTTGSTAYALSAGGPIIDTRLDIMEVVFICPLTAGLKPFILPSSSRVEVTVLPDAATGMLVLDGQLAIDLDYNTPVIVTRSDRGAVFMRVNKPDFYPRIREKIRTGLEV